MLLARVEAFLPRNQRKHLPDTHFQITKRLHGAELCATLGLVQDARIIIWNGEDVNSPVGSVREAADLIGVPRRSMYHMIATGQVRAWRVGERTLRVDLTSALATVRPVHE